MNLTAGAALAGDLGGLEDDAGCGLLVGQRVEIYGLAKIGYEDGEAVAELAGVTDIEVGGYGLDVLVGVEAELPGLHPGVVDEVRAVVALRVCAAGADVPFVWVAEVFDEGVLGFELHRLKLVLAGDLRLVEHPEAGAIELRLVERAAGVCQSGASPLAYLLVVGVPVLARSDWRKVEGNRAGCQANRGEPGVDAIDLLLDVGDHGCEGGEFGDCGAVDAGEPFVLEGYVDAARLRRDPSAAVDVPAQGGDFFVDERGCLRVSDGAHVEGEVFRKRRDELALLAQFGVRAGNACPCADFGYLAGEAAAQCDTGVRQRERESHWEVEVRGGDDGARGVDDDCLARAVFAAAEGDERVGVFGRVADGGGRERFARDLV